MPTDFAVEYDTLTANTTSNQAILATTQVLPACWRRSAGGKLARQAARLRQSVDPGNVTPREADAIATTPLNAYYADLLTLSKLVLERRFFENLTCGAVASFGLFLNMGTLYEAVVERAAKTAVGRFKPMWEVERQGSLNHLTDGQHPVEMQQYVLVRDANEEVQLVVDAKWKTGEDSSGDLYQLTSYKLSETISVISSNSLKPQF